MLQGCHLFLAHITIKETGDKSKKKQLQDVPIVKNFPEVFPRNCPGSSPPDNGISHDLVPGAAPVARAPYRLAPSEMKELADQLQELSDKGFIRPSSSPWELDSNSLEDKIDLVQTLSGQIRIVFLIDILNLFQEQARARRHLKNNIGVVEERGVVQDRIRLKDWASPKTPTEIRQFLGLAGAPILALPEGSEDFIVYCDASKKVSRVVDAKGKGTGSSSVRSEDLEALSRQPPMDRVALVITIAIFVITQKANVVADA
ncbi:hypothetical protein Tco_0446643 [Tanacetum coccineum]